jgi:hypothetical protein
MVIPYAPSASPIRMYEFVNIDPYIEKMGSTMNKPRVRIPIVMDTREMILICSLENNLIIISDVNLVYNCFLNKCCI